MLRLNQLRLPAGHSEEDLGREIAKKLGVSTEDIRSYQIVRHSIDCRKKPVLFDSYIVDVKLKSEKKEKTILKKKGHSAVKAEYNPYRMPVVTQEGQKKAGHVIVCGSGPAGLFCAYILSKCHVEVTVVERGAPVDRRRLDVEKFWESGQLAPSSNVQFGEGGAGTFSDGKLNTLVKDKEGRSRFVLETFVSFGAPEHILTENKPHIGTDILCTVIKNMRLAMESAGVRFLFDTQLTDVDPDAREVFLNSGTVLKYDSLVLAPGHSARDTFSMLCGRGMKMQAKSFAVGVRVIHPQSLINMSQYGRQEELILPAASYKLAEQLESGRGGYSFCMCPGGYVVNASSEEERLAVNGMSYHARDGYYANSAIIVSVTPDDYENDSPLAGIAFQRGLEEKAYMACGGRIPVQLFGDFVSHRKTKDLPDLSGAVKGMYAPADLREVLPSFLCDGIEEAVKKMGRKIAGFDSDDTLLCAVESRTSSPVRLTRNEKGVSSFPHIYPCGEGAGYAGGIMYAAMDGMKIAEHILADTNPL